MQDEDEGAAGAVSRVGWVEMEKVTRAGQPPAGPSAGFLAMQRTLEQSQRVFADSQARGDLKLEEQLTAVLDGLVAAGDISGLMIGSDDGLLVAQSGAMQQGETLAALSSLFEMTVARAQREGIVRKVEELVMRGAAGEFVVMRHFPQMPHFFLIAYAAQMCTYRRLTTQALRRCGDLLRRVSAKPAGEAASPQS